MVNKSHGLTIKMTVLTLLSAAVFFISCVPAKAGSFDNSNLNNLKSSISNIGSTGLKAASSYFGSNGSMSSVGGFTKAVGAVTPQITQMIKPYVPQEACDFARSVATGASLGGAAQAVSKILAGVTPYVPQVGSVINPAVLGGVPTETVVNKINGTGMYIDSWKDNTAKVAQTWIDNSASAATSQAQKGINIIQKGDISAAPGWVAGTVVGTAVWAANSSGTLQDYKSDTAQRVIECLGDTLTTNKVDSVMQRSGLTDPSQKRQVYDIMHDKVGYNVGEVFHDDNTLGQVIGNHMAGENDSRPVAVYIAPSYASTDDAFLPNYVYPKGVVEEGVADNMAAGYNVKYYSADNDKKIITALSDGFRGQENKPGIATIAAHGERDNIMLQSSPFREVSILALQKAKDTSDVPFRAAYDIEQLTGLPVYSNPVTETAINVVNTHLFVAGTTAYMTDRTFNSGNYLALDDEAMLGDSKSGISLKNKSVAFMSCLVGNGEKDTNNVVNMVARQFPEADHVFGATESISGIYYNYKPKGGLDSNTRYYSTEPLGYDGNKWMDDILPVQSYDGITGKTQGSGLTY